MHCGKAPKSVFQKHPWRFEDVTAQCQHGGASKAHGPRFLEADERLILGEKWYLGIVGVYGDCALYRGWHGSNS